MGRMETENSGRHTSIQQPSRLSLKNTEVKVWDLFIRAFHWSLVALVATAFLSADWREVHLWSGYAVCSLLAARMMWGFIGPRYARFGNFLKSPSAVRAYVRSVLERRAPRYLGHNPAGGAMVAALLLMLAAVSITGVLLQTDPFWGSETMQMWHGVLANIAVALLPIHIAGVIITGVRLRENLIWSMITGRKRAPKDGDVV